MKKICKNYHTKIITQKLPWEKIEEEFMMKEICRRYNRRRSADMLMALVALTAGSYADGYTLGIARCCLFPS